MTLNIISFFTGRKIVWLIDFQGDMYRTIELKKPHPFTKKKCAYVYWFTKTRLVSLDDNGECTDGGYIKKWAYEL